jgi:hypothetical protein
MNGTRWREVPVRSPLARQLELDVPLVVQLLRSLAVDQVQADLKHPPSTSLEHFHKQTFKIILCWTAIETWDAYAAAADRRWLEPLFRALFSVDPRFIRDSQ